MLLLNFEEKKVCVYFSDTDALTNASKHFEALKKISVNVELLNIQTTGNSTHFLTSKNHIYCGDIKAPPRLFSLFYFREPVLFLLEFFNFILFCLQKIGHSADTLFKSDYGLLQLRNVLLTLKKCFSSLYSILALTF